MIPLQTKESLATKLTLASCHGVTLLPSAESTAWIKQAEGGAYLIMISCEM